MGASSLKALKAKISKHEGQARKLTMKVLHLNHDCTNVQPADIVMIAKPRYWETDYENKIAHFGGYGKKPAVWITTLVGNKVERSKVALDRCVLPNEENRVVIESARLKFAQAKSLKEKATDMLKGLPRITVEELTGMAIIEDNLDD